jgi:hemin uptake protein HemP
MMNTQPLDDQDPGHGSAIPDFVRTPATDAPTRVLRSEDVLAGDRSVEILHAGSRYRLSVTATGKLILTK